MLSGAMHKTPMTIRTQNLRFLPVFVFNFVHTQNWHKQRSSPKSLVCKSMRKCCTSREKNTAGDFDPAHKQKTRILDRQPTLSPNQDYFHRRQFTTWRPIARIQEVHERLGYLTRNRGMGVGGSLARQLFREQSDHSQHTQGRIGWRGVYNQLLSGASLYTTGKKQTKPNETRMSPEPKSSRGSKCLLTFLEGDLVSINPMKVSVKG